MAFDILSKMYLLALIPLNIILNIWSSVVQDYICKTEIALENIS